VRHFFFKFFTALKQAIVTLSLAVKMASGLVFKENILYCFFNFLFFHTTMVAVLNQFFIERNSMFFKSAFVPSNRSFVIESSGAFVICAICLYPW
jgi:hypothetical protein